MSVTVKRKRGRPRLDEPKEIQDFDHNLIEQFKSYPVFYDRQHPQHRNREYTDRIWQRIAQNLNVSTNLARTRMLQLRNRFNLEKRRVEAMQEQQNSVATSQWSLYERLSFLSTYVKTRRPYSLPNSKAAMTASSSEGEDENDVEELEVNGSNHKQNENGNQVYLSYDGVDLQQQQVQANTVQPAEANIDTANKYKSFGKFLASSLIEMNEIQALGLVEKFTSDIVKYLQNEEKKKSFIDITQTRNSSGDEENSSTFN